MNTPTISVFDVFTPTRHAEKGFVEREKELNNQLVQSLRTPGMQVVLYGHSKSGKSSLIFNKLNQLYENVVITRCMDGMNMNQLLVNAFDSLDKYYIKGASNNINSSISVGYNNIKAQMDSSITEITERIVPVQLTAQRLAEFFGEISCCWVLEDFHKIELSEKKKLSQMLKVFMDTATEYPDVKIIAIGAVGTGREVVEYDIEMKDRVTEINVPLLSPQEIAKIIYKGEELLNLKFKNSVIKKIQKYSNGLGSICHQLCLNMCINQDIHSNAPERVSFNDSHLNTAIQTYLNSRSDSMKKAFDEAVKIKRSGKYENGKLILNAIIELDKEECTYNEILSIIQKENIEYPAGNLTLYLKQLTSSDRGAILRYDASANKYSYTDPFMKAYAQCLIDSKDLDSKEEFDFQISIKDLLKRMEIKIKK